MICKDCGNKMTQEEVNHHDSEPEHIPEHIGRCCDCTDELFGMPADQRRLPRMQGNKYGSGE